MSTRKEPPSLYRREEFAFALTSFERRSADKRIQTTEMRDRPRAEGHRMTTLSPRNLLFLPFSGATEPPDRLTRIKPKTNIVNLLPPRLGTTLLASAIYKTRERRGIAHDGVPVRLTLNNSAVRGAYTVTSQSGAKAASRANTYSTGACTVPRHIGSIEPSRICSRSRTP